MSLLLFLSVYLAIASGWAALFSDSGQKKAGSGMADAWSGRQVQLTGTVTDLYRPADGSQENISFTLQNITMLSDTEGISDGQQPTSIQSENFSWKDKRILCRMQAGETLPRAGSGVRIAGKVQPFLEATNPGEFDARAYYERQGILFTLKEARILAQTQEYDRIGECLSQLRFKTAAFYRIILGEADGAIASAMVLGIRKDMDAQIKSLYQDAGIAHVLAISGLHITFIGMAVLGMLKKMRIPLPVCALISGTLLFLYGRMVGMGVSTKRALLMFFLLLAAQLLRRTPDTLTSLTIAACLILIPNPGLLFDSGFRLSFLAVTGAATAVPVLQEEGIRSPLQDAGRRKQFVKSVKKSMAASFGITLFTLPALLDSFYQWNPWSIFANLAVIPLMGVLLVWLFVLAAACWLFAGVIHGPLFWKILVLPAQGIFWLYEKICRIVLLLPGSSLHTGAPKLWQVLLFAAGMAAFLFYGKKLPPICRSLCAVLLAAVFMIRLPGRLTVTMLDVGQGECVCLETARHHFYLLDAGSSSKSKTGQYQIIPFLEYSGVRRLEAIIISHWDADHISALEEIFAWSQTERAPIGALLLPDIAFTDDALSELLLLAEEYGIGVQRIRAGQSLQEGEMKLECLHPYVGERVTDRNQSSAVIKLTAGEFSALFTGDLEEDGESWLLQSYEPQMLDCTILDAGHHGSANASTAEFLEAVSPGAVLISCGRNNRYGHPAQETLGRIADMGVACHITAKQGAIIVTVKRDGISVKGFLEE